MAVEGREQVTRVETLWVNGQPEEPGGFRRKAAAFRGGTSRMNREIHVRICERLGVQFPGATRQTVPLGFTAPVLDPSSTACHSAKKTRWAGSCSCDSRLTSGSSSRTRMTCTPQDENGRLMADQSHLSLSVARVLAISLALGTRAPASLGAQRATEDRVQNPGWWPTQGAAHRSDYLGPAACAECHPSEAASQRTAPMAHAAARAVESDILRAHARLNFQLGSYSYQIARAAGGSDYSVSNGAKTISEELLWAFGVGEVGQTYVFEREGTYYESRLSYYRALEGWDFTTGHPRSPPAFLEDAVGRPMDAAEAGRCFGCHTTASTTGNQFDPSRLIPGVTCEACHGPGAKHVAAMKAGRLQQGRRLILNPAQFKPVDSIDFCGACHRTSWDVKLMGVTGVANVRFQPYRLENSRCWGKGVARLTCVACHDPHKPLERNAAPYDERCLRCHPARPQGATAKLTREHPRVTVAACPVGARNCVNCHMPKVELPEMHFDFTDHQIRVVRAGEVYPN